MPAKTHGERLDRLEQVVTILAEGRISLEKTVAELATATRRGFDQVAAQFDVIGKRMAETDERMRQMAQENAQRSRDVDDRIRQLARENSQRSREVDERVDKLVLAIGKTDLRT